METTRTGAASAARRVRGARRTRAGVLLAPGEALRFGVGKKPVGAGWLRTDGFPRAFRERRASPKGPTRDFLPASWLGGPGAQRDRILEQLQREGARRPSRGPAKNSRRGRKKRESGNPRLYRVRSRVLGLGPMAQYIPTFSRLFRTDPRRRDLSTGAFIQTYLKHGTGGGAITVQTWGQSAP